MKDTESVVIKPAGIKAHHMVFGPYGRFGDNKEFLNVKNVREAEQRILDLAEEIRGNRSHVKEKDNERS